MEKGSLENGRLTSWKEIASFLNVTVRTAQNWEKELGLPVHRLGQRRGPVFSYCAELERWLQEQLGNEANAACQTDAQAAPKPRRAEARPKRIRLISGAILAVLFLATFSAWSLMGHDPNPVSVTVEFKHLEVFNREGRLLWRSKELMGSHGVGNQPDGRPRINSYLLINDIDGDGLNEVFFSDFPESPDVAQGRILAFTHDGKPLWREPLTLGRPIEWGDRSFNRFYFSQDRPLPFSFQGTSYLVVLIDQTWFPSAALIVRASDGRVESEYWHPGRFTDVALMDLDSDGKREFVFCGVNNPGPGDGNGFVARVDLEDMLTSQFNPHDPFGLQSSIPSDYILIENTDVAKAMGVRLVPLNLTQTNQGVRFSLNPGGFYAQVPSDFRSLRFEVSDEAARIHKQYETTGALDHAFDKQEILNLKTLHFSRRHPNANSEAIRKELGETGGWQGAAPGR